MASVIQFTCPACGALLRIPLEMAASSGPCPCCLEEINAPDPDTGTGATRAVVPVLLPVPDPPPRPEPPIAKVEAPSPLPSSPEAAPPAAPYLLRAFVPILIFSCVLTAALFLVTGFLAGSWFAQKAQPSPPPVSIPPPPLSPPVTEPAPPPPSSPQPAPVKISTAAETTLRAFLDAPDWAARSAYVLTPDLVRPAMKAYSREGPDGPTAFESISVLQSELDRKSGKTFFIFQVSTKELPHGIPAVVVETDGGWLVDWESFIEFRDDWFGRFADGPADRQGTFHLLVKSNQDAGPDASNEHFDSFILSMPSPGRERIAFVKKNSSVHTRLSEALSVSPLLAPVLELAKRQTPDGKSYLEIISIAATDWRPPLE